MTKGRDEIRDELLVLRCQEGDGQAFDELVGRWQRRLWAYARRLTGDAEAAWEVAQESWMAIVRGIRRLDDAGAFRPWALRIVGHKSADWVRRRQRSRDREVSHQCDPVAAEANGPGQETLAELRAAIGQLPVEHREVLVLHYLEDLSVAEIGRMLRVPAGTVKSRLHYARERLRERLE